jgi:hypothetical protein
VHAWVEPGTNQIGHQDADAGPTEDVFDQPAESPLSPVAAGVITTGWAAGGPAQSFTFYVTVCGVMFRQRVRCRRMVPLLPHLDEVLDNVALVVYWFHKRRIGLADPTSEVPEGRRKVT